MSNSAALETPATFSTDELAAITRIPRELVLAILDAGLFKETASMANGRPIYTAGAIEVVGNIEELAIEVDAGRCSSFSAWLMLSCLLKPTIRPASTQHVNHKLP